MKRERKINMNTFVTFYIRITLVHIIMPNYTYKCDHCKVELTLFRSMDQRENQACPECKNKLIKLLDVPNLTGMNKFGSSN
jgi:putative FmdB family regulatory protein